jgi:hypothetical protein
MDSRTFEDVFKGEIRTAINWRAVQASNPRVTEFATSNRPELGDFRIPWYKDGASWRDDDRRRRSAMLTVREASSLIYSDARNKLTILKLAESFCEKKPAPMMLPFASFVYDARKRNGIDRVALDGVHRMIALYVSNVNFMAMCYVLHVPAAARAAIFDL